MSLQWLGYGPILLLFVLYLLKRHISGLELILRLIASRRLHKRRIIRQWPLKKMKRRQTSHVMKVVVSLKGLDRWTMIILSKPLLEIEYIPSYNLSDHDRASESFLCNYTVRSNFLTLNHSNWHLSFPMNHFFSISKFWWSNEIDGISWTGQGKLLHAQFRL